MQRTAFRVFEANGSGKILLHGTAFVFERSTWPHHPELNVFVLFLVRINRVQRECRASMRQVSGEAFVKPPQIRPAACDKTESMRLRVRTATRATQIQNLVAHKLIEYLRFVQEQRGKKAETTLVMLGRQRDTRGHIPGERIVHVREQP